VLRPQASPVGYLLQTVHFLPQIVHPIFFIIQEPEIVR